MKISNELKLVLILIALPFVWYAIPIFTDSRYFVGDLMDQYYPWWTYAHDSFHAGKFPLWNPYALSGLPYHVGPQNALFYPLNIPLFFLPFCDAMVILRVVHTIVASLGMYFLLRNLKAQAFPSFIGALMFSYGSFMSYEIIYLTYINTVVWFPWQLLFIHKLVKQPVLSNAVLLAIFTATSFLGGMPQVFFCCHLSLGVFFLFMLMDSRASGECRNVLKTAVYLGLAGILTVGMTLMLLGPAVRFMAFASTSKPELIYAFIQEYSFIESAYQALFFPFVHVLFGAPYPPVQQIYNVEVPYMGVVAVFLTLFHFRSRKYSAVTPAVIVIACFGILMSKGTNTGFFPWMFHHFRPFQWFRWPYDYLHMLYPTLAIAAATGLDIFWRQPRKYLRWSLTAAVIYLGGAACWIPCGLTFILFFIVLFAALAVFLLIPKVTPEMPHQWQFIGAFLFSVLLLVDLSWYGYDFKRFMPRSLFELDKFKPVAEFLQKNNSSERVAVSTFDFIYMKERQNVFFEPFLTLHNGKTLRAERKTARDWLRALKAQDLKKEMWFRENRFKYSNFYESMWDIGVGVPSHTGMIFKYQGIGGHDRFMNERVRHMYSTIPIGRIWDLFNVKYIVTPNRIVNEKLNPVYSTAYAHAYKNTGVLPRVMTPQVVRESLKEKEVFERIKQSEFDPRVEVLLEDEIDAPNEDIVSEPYHAAANNGRIVEYEANRVLVEVDMKTAGPVVLHDIFYPGWDAYVGGEKLEIFRANYVFRACFVPAGRHLIEFKYVPCLFYISAIISAAFWAFCLIMLSVDWLRKKGKRCISNHDRNRNR